ncbi:MAG: chemotaxis protein CheX [Terriglobales bacterium]
MNSPRVTNKVTDKATDKVTDEAREKAGDQATGPVASITPRDAWLAVLRKTTSDVFATMVGISLDVTPATVGTPLVSESQDASVVAYVTGMIGIAGAVRAVFSLRCSDLTAARIASRMLGISAEEAAAQKSDAIGEICNMIAGHFKHEVGHGDSCTLTIPTVVVGGSYSIHCLEKGERLAFPITCEGETVLVALDIRG